MKYLLEIYEQKPFMPSSKTDIAPQANHQSYKQPNKL